MELLAYHSSPPSVSFSYSENTTFIQLKYQKVTQDSSPSLIFHSNLPVSPVFFLPKLLRSYLHCYHPSLHHPHLTTPVYTTLISKPQQHPNGFLCFCLCSPTIFIVSLIVLRKNSSLLPITYKVLHDLAQWFSKRFLGVQDVKLFS